MKRQAICPDTLLKIREKAEKKCFIRNGYKIIKPKQLRWLLSYIRIPKSKLYRVGKHQQDIMIKEMESQNMIKVLGKRSIQLIEKK